MRPSRMKRVIWRTDTSVASDSSCVVMPRFFFKYSAQRSYSRSISLLHAWHKSRKPLAKSLPQRGQYSKFTSIAPSQNRTAAPPIPCGHLNGHTLPLLYRNRRKMASIMSNNAHIMDMESRYERAQVNANTRALPHVASISLAAQASTVPPVV